MFQDMAQTLPVQRLVVIDESSTHRDMTTRYARAPRGQRAYDTVVRNFGQNVSLLAARRLEGMSAPLVIEGAVTTPVFEAYVERILAPTLQPGDIVILDNLVCHTTDTVRQTIEARGASVLFLPAYSPDLSPIEHAFSKIKAVLRRIGAHTLSSLLDAIALALAAISPADALGYFIDCGFFAVP